MTTFFGKPRLTYAPFDAANPASGRFYLAWLRRDVEPDGSISARPLIAFTRGNRFPLTSPEPGDPLDLRFLSSVLFYNEWTSVSSGISLTYAGGAVRGAVNMSGKVSFFPFADGAYPGVQRDTDDYAIAFQNMACGLKGNCGHI